MGSPAFLAAAVAALSVALDGGGDRGRIRIEDVLAQQRVAGRVAVGERGRRGTAPAPRPPAAARRSAGWRGGGPSPTLSSSVLGLSGSPQSHASAAAAGAARGPCRRPAATTRAERRGPRRAGAASAVSGSSAARASARRGRSAACRSPELAILVGLIAAVVGFLEGGGAPLIVGLIVCGLGVLEITGREHFSGYRSHTALLAALPAVAIEVALVLAFGEPKQRRAAAGGGGAGVRGAVLAAARKFLTARQARVARMARRPPARSALGTRG